MGYRFLWNNILVMQDDLRAFAWSAPMRELASKLGMSDVGLKKQLASYGVVSPPQGYWNKVHAGKPVPKRPTAPPRRPGEIGRIRVDERFAKVVPQVRPMPSIGPFASLDVPENLEELRAQELKAIGRATAPKSLDGAHRGLMPILKQEKRRREKVAEGGYHWDTPKFDTPLDKRRLRIINGIFLALAKRGHDGDATERDDMIEARAIIGDTGVSIDIAIVGKHREILQRGRMQAAPDLPASTPLELRIEAGRNGEAAELWRDDKKGELETKIAPIAAALIVAGEAKFRRELGEAERWAEGQREDRDRRQAAKLAELNEERLANLRRSGELLRQAQDIRALVEQMRQAMSAGVWGIDSGTIFAWEQWALAEADRLDPVRSGQVLSHLREASLDQIQL